MRCSGVRIPARGHPWKADFRHHLCRIHGIEAKWAKRSSACRYHGDLGVSRSVIGMSGVNVDL